MRNITGIWEYLNLYEWDTIGNTIVQYLTFGFLEEFEDFIEICSLQ